MPGTGPETVVILIFDGNEILELFQEGGFFVAYDDYCKSRGMTSGIQIKIPAEMGSSFGACVFIPRSEVSDVLYFAECSSLGAGVYSCLSSS